MRVLVHEYCSGGGAIDGASAAEAAALAEQGRAMRDAMAADVAALAWHDLLLCESADAWEGLVRQADAVWSVAPETGGVLAAIAASVPGPKWLGCTPAAIRLAGSKSATRGRLAAAGIAVPAAGSADGAGRFVVKPDDGAGATDTVAFGSFAEARRHARAGTTIESWVDGEPLSLALLCSRGGAELLGINRQRIGVGADGRIVFEGVEIAVEPLHGERGSRLRTLAARVAAALPGLNGFVGVDLVWHVARGPVVIEVNPRVTSAYVGLSAKLGRNLARELLALPRDA